MRQAGKPEAVDDDTVFQLASLSKPIAATVVAALAGDGKVAWDDPIVRHDPEFAMQDAWVTREITLRDMFCHRSGLPPHAGDTLEDIGYGRREVLHRLRYVKPATSFRARYALHQFRPDRGGGGGRQGRRHVVGGRLRREALPAAGHGQHELALRGLQGGAEPGARPRPAGGQWVAKYTRDPDAQSPAGGVCSTARDLAQWLRLQLAAAAGRPRDRQGGGAGREPPGADRQAPAANPMTERSSFSGLGWDIGNDTQGIRWSHSGGFNLGAAACVNVLPAERLGIVVLTNTAPIGVPEAICRSFLDLATIGKVERDWLALFGQAMAAVIAPDYGTAVDYGKPPLRPTDKGRTDALAADAYVGSYYNDLYGRIAVARIDRGLALRLGPRQQPYALRHFDRDVFTYQPVGENAYGPSAVTFQVGAEGAATAVTIENLDTTGQGRFERVAS